MDKVEQDFTNKKYYEDPNNFKSGDKHVNTEDVFNLAKLRIGLSPFS